MTDPAQQMQDDALEAQVFSRKYLVLELDFSKQSIAEIEDCFETLPYAIPGGLSGENIGELTRMWGAYLGECLRRDAQAEWMDCPDGSRAVRGPKATVMPHREVRRRLTNPTANVNLMDYYRDALAQLLHAGNSEGANEDLSI